MEFIFFVAELQPKCRRDGQKLSDDTREAGIRIRIRWFANVVFEVVKSGWDMCEANADSSHYIKHTGNVEKTSRNNPSVFMDNHANKCSCQYTCHCEHVGKKPQRVVLCNDGMGQVGKRLPADYV